MDYSLLIAVRRLPAEVAASCGAGPLPEAAPSEAPAGTRRELRGTLVDTCCC